MFTRICREIVDVAIYALYPESFCGVNLAIRKVFAFSDSGGGRGGVTWLPHLLELWEFICVDFSFNAAQTVYRNGRTQNQCEKCSP